MTNVWQSDDKRMLMQQAFQSTKGGGQNFIPLTHPPQNNSGPDAEPYIHDEDLYTFNFLRGAISEKPQEAVSHV